MRKKKTYGLRISVIFTFVIIALAFPFIDGCDLLNYDSGGDSDDDPAPTTVSTLEDTTISIEVVNTALTADEPLITAEHVQLPPNFQVALLSGISINLEDTLPNIAITRTDGGTSPNPTVDFTVSVAAGNDPDACDVGTATQAFGFGVTGNANFSSTSVNTDDGTISQDAADIISSRDFTLCTNATSSVGVNLSITGINIDFSVAPSCDAEENQNLAGIWTGTYYCEEDPDGDDNWTRVEEGIIELTITQADGAAIYVDDGGATYFGNVCDTSFEHSGVGPSYYEWGTFTIIKNPTSSVIAEKESYYVPFYDPTAGGRCFDEFDSRTAP